MIVRLLFIFGLLEIGCILRAMEEVIKPQPKKHNVTTLSSAQRIAGLSADERKKYTLHPYVIASVIKQKMLNNCIGITAEEEKLITDLKSKSAIYKQLESVTHQLLNTIDQPEGLQEIRAKIFERNQHVFFNKCNKKQELEAAIAELEGYENKGCFRGWVALWLAEVIAAGVIGALVVVYS